MNIQIVKSNDDEFLKIQSTDTKTKLPNPVTHVVRNIFSAELGLLTHALRKERFLDVSKDRIDLKKKSLPSNGSLENIQIAKKQLQNMQANYHFTNHEVLKNLPKIFDSCLNTTEKNISKLESILLQKSSLDNRHSKLEDKSNKYISLIDHKMSEINNLNNNYKSLKTPEEKNKNRIQFDKLTDEISSIKDKFSANDELIIRIDRDILNLNKMYTEILDENFVNLHYFTEKTSQLSDESLFNNLSKLQDVLGDYYNKPNMSISRSILENKNLVGHVKNMKKDSSPNAEKIYHLGGTRLASFDPSNEHVKLNKKNYFYEGVAVQVGQDELFIYGNELKGFTDQWIKESSKQKNEISFQQFMTQKLESTPGLAEDLKKRSVYYFTDFERHQTTVEVVHGALNQIGLGSQDDKLKALKPGDYAYVIASVFDEEKEEIKKILLATLKKPTNKGLIQHSSFVRGGNVHTAGMIHIDAQGKIKMITDKSGHYLPTDKEMAYTLGYLKDAGFDISTFNVNFTFKLQQVPADVWFNEIGNKLI